MGPVTVRHVRYQDFIALSSDGVCDLAGFQAAVDELVRRIGEVSYYHVLIDVRAATWPPLPDALVVQALEHLRRRHLGTRNRVAVVIDPTDSARVELMHAVHRAADALGMSVRGFSDYGLALDYLDAFVLPD
jgi:hypothetical protein